jgi:thiamine biosynthesis lipoprotein
MHHIIDTSTGAPVRDTWRTVRVAAANCTDANIAATAAIVRAHTGAMWLAGQGLPARRVDWDGYVTTVGDWPVEAAVDALAIWEALAGWAWLAV